MKEHVNQTESQIKDVIKNDRIILELNPGLYTAEIFDYNRSFKYESMCCGNCKHKIFTEFYANLISKEVVKKANFTPDVTLNYSTDKEKLKFIVCDKCFNINITNNFVEILVDDEDSVSYSYEINKHNIILSSKLYNQLQLYFWQTQKEPIYMIINEIYHNEAKKYLDSNLLDEFNNIYKEYLKVS
ncbi:hypothetical protein ACOTVS_09965 [Aliarcobacter butzleri]|uniref:hypothetical protein n=1 Tax=Aliarcobacter butzleri TaxID=28197 RepID=UPI00344F177E